MKISKNQSFYKFFFYKDLSIMEKINFKRDYKKAKEKYFFLNNFLKTLYVIYKYSDIVKQNKK